MPGGLNYDTLRHAKMEGQDSFYAGSPMPGCMSRHALKLAPFYSVESMSS